MVLHRFRASRWSPGNRLFPTVLEVSDRHVTRVKRSFVGRIEESISIRQVSSVTIARGALWSDITVHSSGGTDPLRSHGHANADAECLKQVIEEYQTNIARTGVADLTGLKTCEHCAEMVKSAARVCRFCGGVLPIELTDEAGEIEDPPGTGKEWTWG